MPKTTIAMSNSIDDVHKSGTTIEGKDDKGVVVPLTKEDIAKKLSDGMKLVECTVSVREGRQHAQFLASERFISGQIKMHDAWDTLALLGDTLENRGVLSDCMTRKIMQIESYLYERIYHMQKKNNLPTFPRDSNNPYVSNAWSLIDAEKTAGKR